MTETDETRVRVLPDTLTKLNRLEEQMYGSSSAISHEAFLNQMMDHYADSVKGIDL